MTVKENLQYLAYKYPKTAYLLTCITCPVACCVTCPLWCWLSTPWYIGGTMRRKYGNPKHQNMTNVHFERRGRRTNRRNSLSEGKPVGRWTRLTRKRTSDQSSSSLFSTLPYEIRALIFEYALTGTEAVRICHGPRRPRFPIIMSRPYPFSVTTHPETRTDDGIYLARLPAVSLLRSCRRLYTEALPFLYARNEFVFEHVPTFTNFTHIVPKGHLHLIRSLRFVQPLRRYWVDYYSPNVLAGRLGPLIGSWHRLQELHLVFQLDAIMEMARAGNGPGRWAEECADQMSAITPTQCKVHVYIFNDVLQHCHVPHYHVVKQGTRRSTEVPAVQEE